MLFHVISKNLDFSNQAAKRHGCTIYMFNPSKHLQLSSDFALYKCS